MIVRDVALLRNLLAREFVRLFSVDSFHIVFLFIFTLAFLLLHTCSPVHFQSSLALFLHCGSSRLFHFSHLHVLYGIKRICMSVLRCVSIPC